MKLRTMLKAKISREKLMDYIQEDRDLLMGLQDDLSDMLYATGKFSITLDEVDQNFMPFIPLYLIENVDENKKTVSKNYMTFSWKKFMVMEELKDTRTVKTLSTFCLNFNYLRL